MTKYVTIYILLLLGLNSKGQISIDSLLMRIKYEYYQTGTTDYLGSKFTKFETPDATNRYDIYLDSNNQLKEHIGLSIVHYTYDSQQRIILIEGFNSKGFRSFWDFPEIQKFRYVNDTVVAEMNRIRDEICDCVFPEILSNVKIVEEINSTRSFNVLRYTIYSKDSLMKLTFAKTSDGKFYSSSNKVSFVYREFDSITAHLIIHERHYDAKLKLVMGKHNLYTSETVAYSAEGSYAYSIRTFDKGLLKTAAFYDKKGKLIKTQQYGVIRGPSAN